jgi:mycothiol synthase
VVWDLELDSNRSVAEPAWPAEVVARAFDRTRDVSALPPLVNAAFADHPTPLVMEEAMVAASLDDPNILDDDAILVEDGQTGELVGFCLVDVHRTDGVPASHAEIGLVGVRPDRQGRGLGRQLLRAGVVYLRSLGVPTISLAVNGRNDGALGLYESEGFARVRTRERWVRHVASAPGMIA